MIGQRMRRYVIKDHQRGIESDQVRIGREVAKKWIWPFAYNLEDLLKVHSQPDFDPSTRHYCFLDNEMVGYMFSTITPNSNSNLSTANLDFPRMLPGHEQAAELLINRAFETLKKKGVYRVVGRVTTMCPGDISLAEKTGFSISDWGYKVYYSYEMAWGKLSVVGYAAEEIDADEELDGCARNAALWYKHSAEWCRIHLAEWHKAGIIAHLGFRQQQRLIASCLVAPNDVRPSTAAIYYIYTPNELSLRPMLARVVDKCIEYGTRNVIADLINEHRQYEPVYQELGFRKVAEWARCERILV
jgi:hypothetical protein